MVQETFDEFKPKDREPSPMERACDNWLSDLDASGDLDSLREFLGEIIKHLTGVLALPDGYGGKTSKANATEQILKCIDRMNLPTPPKGGKGIAELIEQMQEAK